MPTPVNNVIAQIAADWVATQPPDRTTTYPYVYASDETVDPNDQLSHRCFWFEPSVRGEPLSETSDSSLVPYECQAVLILDSDGFTPDEFREALANEAALLARAIEVRTTWPAGTWEVITRKPDPPRLVDEGSTAVMVTFNIEVLVGED